MTLLERIRAERKCSVAWCDEERVEGALFCGANGNGHLTDFWARRLRKTSDGSYIGIAGPNVRLPARDMTTAWSGS